MKTLNVSIDVDNVHHYLKARGYQPLETTNIDSIYKHSIPRFLDLFDQYNIKATFFVIGEDVEVYGEVIKEMHNRGHEIANHTYNHFQYFRDLSKEEMRYEIEKCGDVVEKLTNKKVIGFRAPGWNINQETLGILTDLGYNYDSSVYPSMLIPILNIYNYMSNKGRMKASMGANMKIGSASKKPYYPHLQEFWKSDPVQKEILEIPPTVVPYLNIPFLGTSLYKFGKGLYNFSKTIVESSSDLVLFELHAIELVDSVEVNDARLNVKPGFTFPLSKKVELYHHFLESFKDYKPLSLEQITINHAEGSLIS